MSWKEVLSTVFAFVALTLFVFYWFSPIDEALFSGTGPKNYDFASNTSLESSTQFYPNLRYPDSRISYRIQDCTIKKTDDMKGAFSKIQDLTSLEFYPVTKNEQILVTCDSEAKFDGKFFVAGEGGPTNITESGNFNIIQNGGIILLKDSTCENPNVAIHELLHALGFDHSKNPNNVMYPVSKCNQEIGNDTLTFIDELYSIQGLPDLKLENTSASMRSRYLNISLSVKNFGLKNAPESTVRIYADDDLIKELPMESIDVGAGRIMRLTNLMTFKSGISRIKISIDSNFNELDKSNNVVELEIKS